MFARKGLSVPAPEGSKKSRDGSAAVPWLKLPTNDAAQSLPFTLTEEDGKLGGSQVKEVYRINTAGGRGAEDV